MWPLSHLALPLGHLCVRRRLQHTFASTCLRECQVVFASVKPSLRAAAVSPFRSDEFGKWMLCECMHVGEQRALLTAVQKQQRSCTPVAAPARIQT